MPRSIGLNHLLIKRSFMIVTSVLCIVCTENTSQAAFIQSGEQVHFSAEDDGVKKPILIPATVMAILANDHMVKDALENEKISTGKPPSSWFSASSAHLSKSQQEDLIVVSEPPIAGANTVTFWVFLSKHHSYKLTLTVHAHDLNISDKYSRGYRELKVPGTTSLGAFTVCYKYDGVRYVAFKEKSEAVP